MIIFLTVICLCGIAGLFYKLRELQKVIAEHQAKVAKDFDIISKYLLKLPTREEAERELETAKNEIILMFNKERVELENVRANRSKDTFKSLRVALASNGKENDED